MYVGSAACSQLSALCKLTSLTAGQRPTLRMQAMLPALRLLKCLHCDVPSLHADGSGALPILSKLTALEQLQIESRVAGDYKLAFPPSLQVIRHTCICVLSYLHNL
jgi:hypothetical protein